MKKSLFGASVAWQALALLGAGIPAMFVAATPAMAQDVTAGSLSGTVTDQAGNPVANANVVITSTDRGFSRGATTSAGGAFTVSQLPIGIYSVTVSAPGQRTTRTENVEVTLGGAAYTFQMAGADVTPDQGADIVVVARPQREIDFSGTATGAVFDVQTVADRIPIGRNVESIQLLAPQTTTGDSAFGGVSLAGSSVAENIFYINGMNVTNFRTFIGGSTVPFEFYDQIQVKTGGYQAEFGRNTGGAVIALSRSGGNEFHGGFNFSYTPNRFRETSPDTYRAHNDLDVRKVIEGNIWASGALIKDRLFFFGFLNPRNSYSKDVAQICDPGTLNNCRDTTTVIRRSDTPFYGGKIDLNIVNGHRLEGTYFSDDNEGDLIVNGTPSIEFSGGENKIIKYTGAFTDWITLSALWGKSDFNRTTSGVSDSTPLVYDLRSGVNTYVQGAPAAIVGSATDSRESYRGDVDLKFSAFGDHNMRFGVDYEKLNAKDISQYSGGIYYQFRRSGAAGAQGGRIPANTDFIRVRTYKAGGSFDLENTAFYVQDSWDITDRLNLSLGIRNDHFKNLNTVGDEFVDLKNQWGPRLGFSYDVQGDKRSKLTGFYGRYYLPVAGNTNIRMGGNELFLEDFYTLPVGPGGRYTGSLSSPTLGTLVAANVYSDGSVSPASTLVSKNIKPQYMDEFIAGYERRVGQRWLFSLTGMYRKLGAVLEDVDLDGAGTYNSIVEAYCETQTMSFCRPGVTPHIGSSGYVLFNPGSDVNVDVEDDDGGLHDLTIPASFIGVPKAKRKYMALEFRGERAFDGLWGIAGSYVLASSKGNYEGGVKSDTGQADVGITTDFDEPGFMDGSYGYLPNHRRHTLKLYGTVRPMERFTIGFNALLQSPRKFGCIGTYPLDDGRASDDSTSSFYCKAQVEAGVLNGSGPGGYLIGRGRAFESNWNKRLDLSFAYNLPLRGLDGVTVRTDIFNVFNFKSKLDLQEEGDLDDPDVIEPNYRLPTGYQTPRSIRFSISADF